MCKLKHSLLNTRVSHIVSHYRRCTICVHIGTHIYMRTVTKTLKKIRKIKKSLPNDKVLYYSTVNL